MRITRTGKRGSPYGPLGMLLALWLGLAVAGRADDVKITAAVADDAPEVGQAIDFTIKVEGAADASVPENIQVDGLSITYSGPQTQTQIMFGTGFGSGGHVQRSVVHTYSVVPQHGGQFTIPAQRVTVEGKAYTTQPVSLRVGGGSAGGGGSGGNPAADTKLYYAEMVPPPDNSIYVGEALPFEFRIYVDSRISAQIGQMPNVEGQGFSVGKITRPEGPTQVVRNGRTYAMLTYKSVVTAARSGRVTLGPVSVQGLAQIPQARQRRPRGGPFDDPFFQNPMFGDPFQQMSPPQRITIEGPAQELEVKPLPAAGRPRSFNGAVGTFTISANVKPTMIEAGDPLTITAKISGRGDFDRVTAPQLTDPAGWKTYPPSAKVETDDDLGISGAKTFEMAAISQGRKTESPALEWSYFDPIKEQYVTLTARGTPIKVEGDSQPAPSIAGSRPAASAPAAAAASTPDIMYIRADSGGWGGSFTPVYRSPIFWAAQGVPLVALAAFIGVQAARKRAADKAAQMRGQWRRAKEAEQAKLASRDAPEGELCDAAARVLRLEAAIQMLRDPGTLDVDEVLAARELDGETASRVRKIFDRQAEALYAGSPGGRGAASAQARVDLAETIKRYENAKPAA